MTTETGEVTPNEMGAKAHQPLRDEFRTPKTTGHQKDQKQKLNASLGLLACINVHVDVG